MVIPLVRWHAKVKEGERIYAVVVVVPLVIPGQLGDGLNNGKKEMFSGNGVVTFAS